MFRHFPPRATPRNGCLASLTASWAPLVSDVDPGAGRCERGPAHPCSSASFSCSSMLLRFLAPLPPLHLPSA
eukprot:7057905-Pyramimonas_sp.AAC.1